MRILVTGANGFIGKNLCARLSESNDYDVITFTRDDGMDALEEKIAGVDAVIHLAGSNRPVDPAEFYETNRSLTERLCLALEKKKVSAPVIFSSSVQVALNNPYGDSKLGAEKILESYSVATGNPVAIYRLPNVFGKWCRPDYNSVVATFCHRISNALEINIHDRASKLTLVYIDDLISSFLRTLANPGQGCNQVEVKESYSINVGELADILRGFKQSRYTLESGNVGSGLCRALYATYLSYLSPDNFSYELKANVDERGKFVEVLKTPDSGQFSFFTAKPCVTRGGHYHHTKNEKFLVVRGKALFKFRHLVTNETHQVTTSAETPEIVETIPGWVHDITNISEEELVVMLWANEVFDENKPDTVGAAVDG